MTPMSLYLNLAPSRTVRIFAVNQKQDILFVLDKNSKFTTVHYSFKYLKKVPIIPFEKGLGVLGH
jgi:hypothetical protein